MPSTLREQELCRLRGALPVLSRVPCLHPASPRQALQWLQAGAPASCHALTADEWLATEKRVVVIHRLHQILEPFMLRRQVQDVEGKLPPKVCGFLKT